MRQMTPELQKKIADHKAMEARHKKFNLKSKVEAINEVNSMMQDVVPAYREVLDRWVTSGKKMVKVDGSFVKALADELGELREHYSEKYPYRIQLRYDSTYRVKLSYIRIIVSKSYKAYRVNMDWQENEYTISYEDELYLLHGDCVCADDGTYSEVYRLPEVYYGRTDYTASSVSKAQKAIDNEIESFKAKEAEHKKKLQELKATCPEYFRK